MDLASALGRALAASSQAVYVVDAASQVRSWSGQRGLIGELLAWEALAESDRHRLLSLCAATRADGQHRSLLLVHADRQALIEPICDGPDVVAALLVLRHPDSNDGPRRAGHTFVDAAVHELRTPVTAIKGYAQIALMRLHGANRELLERALRTIVEQADRLGGLVGHLGDASRLQSGSFELHRERCDLAALLRASVSRARQYAPRHSFCISTPLELYGEWDRERINQVLTQLLENAVKYSPAGGPVDVALAVDDGCAVVSVRDSGIGVAYEQQVHVFEAWSKAHGDTATDFGGFGLGLSLCRAIVERHGGSMWLESDSGQGSLFGFRLPLG